EQNTLSFTPSNWEMEQPVTVSAAADGNTSPETVTLTHSASGGDYNTVSQELEVRVTDAAASLVLSSTTLKVDEAGSATYMVKLATKPT
ncbi:MAG: hypothetical protein TH68_10455, partial [Candidatus Synechococcus spongiarum 142]